MITVIGLGFVGLTTALGFSYKNQIVYGFDIDKEKVESIKARNIPFHEPCLEGVLRLVSGKNFFIVEDLKEAIKKSKVVFYCVGTPSNEDGSADLSYLFKAIEDTLKETRKDGFKVLVIKSTIPPSTAKDIIKPFIESLGFEVGRDIGLANNPEFLREGYSWEDFIKPDKIVLGLCDERTGIILEDLYKSFNAPIYKFSLNTAEFTKYLSNTTLSTMISFSNEMSMIADAVGDIDIKASFKVLHLDKRWSGAPAGITSYIYPGCGFGGYCLPKDTQALCMLAASKNYAPQIIRGVLDINRKIKEHIVKKIEKKVNKDEWIGILGLSFKPNSDDVRETPAKDVIQILMDRGYNKIIAYDPVANENFKKRYNFPLEYATCIDEVLKRANQILILTAWDEFKNNAGLSRDNVFDFRYIL